MEGHLSRVLPLVCFLAVTGHVRNFAHAVPSGAPAPACITLSADPNAHLAPPQVEEVPYFVNLSALSDGNGGYAYSPGATYRCKFFFDDMLESNNLIYLLCGV